MKKTHKPTPLEAALTQVVQDTFWMARRYAHGRNTYAPSIVRDAFWTLKANGIDIPPDQTIEAPKDEDITGMNFRTDYLDDINF